MQLETCKIRDVKDEKNKILNTKIKLDNVFG